MSDTTGLVLYDVDEGVCTLTLNNPERRNAWSPDMEDAYFSALDDAASDDAVRAIVVTGADRWFCPGLDSQRLEQAAGPVGLRLEGRRSQHYALTIPKPMMTAAPDISTETTPRITATTNPICRVVVSTLQ